MREFPQPQPQPQPQRRVPSDADLVRDALCGRREPVAELLRRHWDTAAALAGRVLGSPDLAHDAVQEAAIAAMTDLDRLRSPEKFGPWFCGIALNVARRWLRLLHAEMAGLRPDLPSEAPDPAEAAEIADTAARVRDAIATLADGQRHAVRLFYLQGLSHREVAVELGVSVGAVKARLHQARAALAPMLAELTPAELTAAERAPGAGRQPAYQAPQQTCPPVQERPKENAMAEGTPPAADTAEWAEVIVREICRSEDDDIMRRKHVMLLAEREGERTLPIWIGPAEATVLALALEAVETPRPFPYKLAAGLVEAAGSRITEVRITRLTGGIFYATVVLAGPAGPREVDARPSDAVNLAVAAGAPVMVNTELFAPPDGTGPAPRQVRMVAATAAIAAESRQRMREEAGTRACRQTPDIG